jgi:lipid A 3-O-deacylase
MRTLWNVVLLVLLLLVSAPVRAEESGRIMVIEENDSFVRSGDKHYTQGFRLTYLSAPVGGSETWEAPFDVLEGPLMFGGSDRKRKYEWNVLGQSIFTPQETNRSALLPQDRPYAAWLYTGAALLQETNYENYSTLENFEVNLGVVGPYALGEQTQNDWHQFIGINSAAGWQNQLKNEPGVMLTYERKWRFALPLGDTFAVDAIPEAGFTGGNILTYGEIGTFIRFGQNIAADYGPNRARPSLSGTGWFNADKLEQKFGWYIYGGTQGRAVARNIFLDGNTVSASPYVPKYPFVADFTAGLAMFWGTSVKVDFSITQRTPEFSGQPGGPDQFGGVSLSFGL